jgi:DNA-binding NtrC family response regulator/mevalonate kinase
VFLGGEHAVVGGAPAVLVNTPPRVYVGVRCVRGQELTLQLWRRGESDAALRKEVESEATLTSYLRASQRVFSLYGGGAIRIATDGIPEAGGNASGAVCCLLGTALLWMAGRVSKEDIVSFANVSPMALTRAFNGAGGASRRAYLDDSPVGMRLLPETTPGAIAASPQAADKAAAAMFLGWCLESCVAHAGKASGYGAFSPLVHQNGPFAFLTQVRSRTKANWFSPAGHPGAARDGSGPYDLAAPQVLSKSSPDDALRQVARNTAELEVAAWALLGDVSASSEHCLGVFYTGVPKNTGRQIDAVGEMPSRRIECLRKVDLLAKRADVGASSKACGPIRNLLVEPPELLADPRQWELTGLLAELHEATRSYCANPSVGTGLRGLAGAMRRVQGVLTSYGLGWYQGEVAMSAVYSAVPMEDYERTAAKLTGGGGGGCVVWIAPAEDCEKIRARLADLSSEPATQDSAVVACVACGWPEEPGLRVEPRMPRNPKARQVNEAVNWPLVGDIRPQSTELAAAYNTARRFAVEDVPVLLVGETGTGKQVVAETMHSLSARKGLLVVVNCASLTDSVLESELFGHQKGAFTGADSNRRGLIMQADGGTLFLDEISSMPLGQQASLLRVIETGKVRPVGSDIETDANVRFICAAHPDLVAKVRSGEFREDLFHRIGYYAVSLPPLRSCRDDIPELARHFLGQFTRRHPPRRRLSFGKPAMDYLCAYEWPGNVRQLVRTIERAVLLRSDGGLLVPADLRSDMMESLYPIEQSQVTGDRDLLAREKPSAISLEKKVQAIARYGSYSKAAQFLRTGETALRYDVIRAKEAGRWPPEVPLPTKKGRR